MSIHRDICLQHTTRPSDLSLGTEVLTAHLGACANWRVSESASIQSDEAYAWQLQLQENDKALSPVRGPASFLKDDFLKDDILKEDGGSRFNRFQRIKIKLPEVAIMPKRKRSCEPPSSLGTTGPSEIAVHDGADEREEASVPASLDSNHFGPISEVGQALTTRMSEMMKHTAETKKNSN